MSTSLACSLNWNWPIQVWKGSALPQGYFIPLVSTGYYGISYHLSLLICLTECSFTTYLQYVSRQSDVKIRHRDIQLQSVWHYSYKDLAVGTFVLWVSVRVFACTVRAALMCTLQNNLCSSQHGHQQFKSRLYDMQADMCCCCCSSSGLSDLSTDL